MSKTMKPPPRRVATPAASNKRKEREVLYAPEIPKVPKFSAAPRAGSSSSSSSSKPREPAAHQNQLLAGYLAHEFLTKGTLLGEKWPAAGGEAATATATATGESKRKKGKGSAEAYKRYVEVADLLKSSGAHLPGVVNPTLLGRYLQM